MRGAIRVTVVPSSLALDDNTINSPSQVIYPSKHQHTNRLHPIRKPSPPQYSSSPPSSPSSSLSTSVLQTCRAQADQAGQVQAGQAYQTHPATTAHSSLHPAAVPTLLVQRTMTAWYAMPLCPNSSNARARHPRLVAMTTTNNRSMH